MREESIPADTLMAHYRILSLLGAGGMGEVYLAEDTKLDRKVALKLLPAEFTTDEDRVRRFVQEAKAASALNHPNIITIYEIGEVGGMHFMTTEFIDGQTLRQRMASERLSLAAALDLTIQIASALTAAHEAGITHRDIKPENIMLRRDGIIKVLDFGLAKLTERPAAEVDTDAATRAKVMTDPGTVMGTPQYMSPEQARGQVVDARSDIFSLGVVLYEMIAGKPPFDGVNALEVIGEILKSEPQPLSAHAPTSGEAAPAELQRIVGKALRKNRDERYQTVRDLLNDLKDLKEELSFTAKRARAGQTEKNEAVTAPADALPTAAGAAVPTTSSAKILLGEIKQHKLGVALALLLAAVAALSYFVFFARSPAGPIDSIAVLPFVNQNRDPETEYRSDGLTESIINSLTQLQNLRVISRSSVFRYKGREADPLAAGKELGVRAVLTGRIMQRGDELSVSAELVDVRENKQLWGERYERKVSDLLAVQREIAKEISGNLRLKLSGAEQNRVTKRYTENPEAYQLYLKGRFYWNQATEDGLKKAIEHFQQAIDKDPRYALAYTGLADSYWSISDLYSPPKEAMPKAKAAAGKALEIDDSLAEAHTSLAVIRSLYDWDWAGAEGEFRRAIELNPNYAEAHHQYSWYLAYLGRATEAIAEMERAQQLDPLSLLINVDLNVPFYLARQYDRSIAQSRKAIEMDPNFFLAHYTLGWASLQKGLFAEGIVELRKARAMEDKPWIVGTLGYAYAVSGKRGEAQRLINELKEQSKQRHVPAYWVGMIYVGLGEKDEAFVWLEKAYADRSIWLAWLKTDPIVDSLRSDPRFTDLMRRVGF